MNYYFEINDLTRLIIGWQFLQINYKQQMQRNYYILYKTIYIFYILTNI